MTTNEEYEQRISRYSWEQLLELWQEIETNQTPQWDSGKALEYLVLRAFQLESADVKYPYSVVIGEEELEQIDGAVYTEGLSCLIECKNLTTRVNIEPIAKMRNQLLRRPGGTIGLVFSRSGFTYVAATLARYIAPQTILLWTGRELGLALTHQQMRRSLILKYRICVEQGIPDYEVKRENLP
jgi:hypothetical protein